MRSALPCLKESDMKKIPVLPVCLLIAITAQLYAQWPDNLTKLEKALCVVEFYLPQFETSEIRDDARFKRDITGILVNDQGLILTSDIIFPANLDILGRGSFIPLTQSPPEDITVSFEKNQKLKASFIGKDEELRLAFIQVEDKSKIPEPVQFVDMDSLARGQRVYLIQHLNGSYDNEIIVSEHHINAIIERPQKKLILEGAIQPLSPGGLAVDRLGRSIGVVYRGTEMMPAEMEIDFQSATANLIEVLPAPYILDLIKNPPRLTQQRQGSGKSWLGIQMQILTKDMAAYWEIPDVSGIIVNSVVPKSPAEQAGIQAGDIITGIENLNIESDDRRELDVFRNYIRMLPEGTTSLSYIRDQHKKTVSVTLRSAPLSQALSEEISEENLRFSVKELTQDIIMANDLDYDIQGIWVSRVEEAGAASLGGLMVNDLIMQINGTPVKNLTEFKDEMRRVIRSNPEYISFFVLRDNKTQFVFVETEK
jgi:serine protease DegQ